MSDETDVTDDDKSRSMPTAAERTKAAKLRLKVRAGQTLKPSEASWLNAYEKERDDVRESTGASRVHEVSFNEKTAEAIGTGDTAAAMAAAAAMTREEGRREDSLARIGIDALVKAAEMYGAMMLAMQRRQESLEKVHVAMLSSWRSEYIGRTEDTAQRIIADAEREAEDGTKKDAVTELIEAMMPAIMARVVGGGNGAPPVK